MAFALESPTLYQLMHGLHGVPFGTNQTPPEGRACFEDLRAPIERLMAAAGTHEFRDSEEQADLYWAFLHGLVSLSMNQPRDLHTSGACRREVGCNRRSLARATRWPSAQRLQLT